MYYQTRRPAEPQVGSTICLDKTYLLDTVLRLEQEGLRGLQYALDNLHYAQVGGWQVPTGWHRMHSAGTARALRSMHAGPTRAPQPTSASCRGGSTACMPPRVPNPPSPSPSPAPAAQFHAGGFEAFWRLLAKDNPMCTGSACQTGAPFLHTAAHCRTLLLPCKLLPAAPCPPGTCLCAAPCQPALLAHHNQSLALLHPALEACSSSSPRQPAAAEPIHPPTTASLFNRTPAHPPAPAIPSLPCPALSARRPGPVGLPHCHHGRPAAARPPAPRHPRHALRQRAAAAGGPGGGHRPKCARAGPFCRRLRLPLPR